MLVALFLVVIVIATISTQSRSNREVIDEAITLFERGVRFASDEAPLKNAVVRVRVLLDENPQQIVVEYGPSSGLMMPKEKEGAGQSLSEEEKAKKKQKSFDQNFKRVTEFQEKNVEIPETIRIIGIATSLREKLVTTGEVSIYFYPTGERDNAIILVANDDEVAALTVPSFTTDLERDYYPTQRGTVNEFSDPQADTAKEVYQTWLTK